MDALDGNAIAGALQVAFGRDMTTVSATCGSCGLSNLVAELRTYPHAPAAISRCPRCEHIMLAVFSRHDVSCVDVSGTASLDDDR